MNGPSSSPLSSIGEEPKRRYAVAASSLLQKRKTAFRCLVQRVLPRYKDELPRHKKGRSGILPFESMQAMKKVFQDFGLPSSYFKICDGALTVVVPYTNRDRSGSATAFEFVAYYVGKHGDWAMALSHNLKSWSTSAYLIADNFFDLDTFLKSSPGLQKFASHPMFLPCIMFFETLKAALTRRDDLKDKIFELKDEIKEISKTLKANFHSATFTENYDQAQKHLNYCSELVEECRRLQEYRKGRYQFWRSFKRAIYLGLKYAQEGLKRRPHRARFDAHRDLEKIVKSTWIELQSLKPRETDLLNLVKNADYKVKASFL